MVSDESTLYDSLEGFVQNMLYEGFSKSIAKSSSLITNCCITWCGCSER
jgi:hypothetical protein